MVMMAGVQTVMVETGVMMGASMIPETEGLVGGVGVHPECVDEVVAVKAKETAVVVMVTLKTVIKWYPQEDAEVDVVIGNRTF